MFSAMNFQECYAKIREVLPANSTWSLDVVAWSHGGVEWKAYVQEGGVFLSGSSPEELILAVIHRPEAKKETEVTDAVCAVGEILSSLVDVEKLDSSIKGAASVAMFPEEVLPF